MTVALAVAALGAGAGGLLLPRSMFPLVAAVGAVLATLASGQVPRAALDDGLVSMAFVAGMVWIAAAADRSGLLEAAALGLARVARSPLVLLAVTFLFAVAVTTLLNLDTTAVLVTPLAVAIARRAGLPVAPFAAAALLAANFGSMLLPTSNLTNLVVWRASSESFATFAGHLAVLAALAIGTTLVVLLVVSRGALRTPVATPSPSARSGDTRIVHDRPLALAAAAVLVVLLALFLAGAPVGPLSLAAGLGLVAFRRSLWRAHVEPGIVVAALALYVAGGVLREAIDIAGSLDATTPALLAMLAGALAAITTNLVAVLVLQPAARSLPLQRALLVGVNLGVGLTPIASLATILWRDALRSRRVAVPWRAYLVIAVPLSVAFVLVVPRVL